MHFEINRGPGDPAIARVAKKLGGGGGNPPPAASGWPTLQVGSKGFQVRALQFLLVQAGFAITADGVFGANTKAAVVAFQARKGLARDGVVGPKTWAAAVVTVRSGSRGAAVKGVQSALNAHGSHLVVDGIAGSGTVAAIVAFQRRSGLSADGIAGAKTWNALV
jgi:peptidoglycan hydrolase-like protein with peptidoglycan-binding domain